MLLAAVLRRYRPGYFGLAGWTATLASLAFLPDNSAWLNRVSAGWTGWDWVLTAGLVLAAALYLAFPSECFRFGDDRGVYANHGVYIARHGRLDPPYPWEGKVEPALAGSLASHSTLEGEVQDCEQHLFAGFFKTPKTLTAQFAHLFPIWLAQAFAAFGYRGLIRVNGSLALVALAVFHGVCLAFVPKPAAVFATLFLALNPGQIWVARATLSEILTQVFLWSGLLMFSDSLAGDRPAPALAAGFLLGSSGLARADELLLVPLLFLTQLTFTVLSEPAGEPQESWRALYATGLPTFALAAAYLACCSRPYFRMIVSHLALLVVGAVVAVVLLLAVPPGLRQIAQAGIMSPAGLLMTALALAWLLAYGYWLRPLLRHFILEYPGHPHHGTRYYADRSVVNLAKYVSPFGLVMAAYGWWSEWSTIAVERKELPLLVVLIVSAGYSALYLYDPFDDPSHYWVIRRYVPVVLPAFILFAAAGAWRLLDALAPPWSLVVAVLVLSFLGVFLIRAGDLMFLFAEGKGVYARLRRLAEKLPRGELILANVSHELLTPLYIAFDRPVVPLKVTTDVGQEVFAQWARTRADEGKPFYFLAPDRLSFLPPGTCEMWEAWVTCFVLESHLLRLPRRVIDGSTHVVCYRVTALPRPSDYLTVPLGGRWIWGVKESGFHGPEEFEGERVRWTNGAAKLEIPLDLRDLPRALRVELAWSGPHEPALRILANGYPVYDGKVPRQQRFCGEFDLTAVPARGCLTVELLSDTFVPATKQRLPNGSLTDSRTLGVLVKEIRLLKGYDGQTAVASRA